jgi:hypothetical protein
MQTRIKVLALIAALLLLHALVVHPWMCRWGTLPGETDAALPGDAYVTEPVIASTRAIGIDAPPSEVWPWLVQIGQGRGGFYSHAWLQNRFGCEMENADRILPEHQNLRVGDGIRLHPENPPLPVVEIAEAQALVLAGRIDPRTGDILPLGGADTTGHVATSWAFVLQSDDGRHTRLLARWRVGGPAGWLQTIGYRLLLEPAAFIMERRMLLGIRDRVESTARAAQTSEEES